MLHFAAATGFKESNLVHYLIGRVEASMIDTQNIKGQTPLHIAILHHNEHVVRELLAAGSFESCLRMILRSLENDTALC